MNGYKDNNLSDVTESCWTDLVTHIGLHNPTLSRRHRESAARQFIQLAAFLRLIEKRDTLSNGPFGELVRSIESQFGTGLFRVCPTDPPLPDVHIDDALLFRTLDRLPMADRSPDVLGHIHQHLLELRSVTDKNGRLNFQKSKQTRKSSGVFYTPECVRRYIVERGLKRHVVEGSLPQLLDPACGCGWFLLSAYRFLRDTADLSVEQIAEHVHGVDVDPEAVLAARRSLWLTLRQDLDRPPDVDLSEAIRCGDALTGPTLASTLGRFDAVLGNPPYRRELGTKHLMRQTAQTEFGRRWRSARMDFSYYFIHRGLELLKPGGLLSFIVGSYWTAGSGAKKLINQLRETTHIEEVFCLDRSNVFKDVSGRHMIIRITKGTSTAPTIIRRPTSHLSSDIESLLDGRTPIFTFEKTKPQLFRDGRIDLEPCDDELLAKLATGTPLGLLGTVRQGIAENPATINPRTNRKHGNRWQVGEGVFALTPDEVERLELPENEKRLLRPYYELGDLGRYRIANAPSRMLIYSTKETCPDIDRFPVLKAHLNRFRPIMESRRETQRGNRAWWQLHWPRDERIWHQAKIVCVQMAHRPTFVPFTRPAYFPFSVNVFVPNVDSSMHLNYITAILNSRLMWKWYRHHAKHRGVGLDINGHVLAKTPIKELDSSNQTQHDQLVELVDHMMESQLDEERAELDRQIDRVVYELYNLTTDQMVQLSGNTQSLLSTIMPSQIMPNSSSSDV